MSLNCASWVGLAAMLLGLSARGSSQSLSMKLDEAMLDAAARYELSGSVLVVRTSKGGATLLAKGFGWANREHETPNTPATKFRIGSVTKQFTAMAILLLQEQGLLGVEDLIARHLPDLPSRWSEITVHQLLTHTSGIMHSWALPGFAESMMIPATIQATIDRYRDQPLVFAPGEGYQYSGVGYFLLARIVEQVSGRSYEDFLRHHIFEPLGMRDTGSDEYGRVLAQRASGYQRTGEQIRNADPIYMPILTGGGNLYSTTEDLGRWARALTAGKLLSAGSYRRMYTPVRENYAYGWRVMKHDQRLEVSHGGSVSGFNALILRYPEEALCVVILSNLTPQKTPGALRSIARELAGIVLSN